MTPNAAIRVLQINGLGDQLLALPALRALDAMHPGCVHLILGPGMR